jgi:membrane protease YdiL (CAAX protease family)
VIYFCPACAKPYKSIDTVVAAAAPKKLTYQELIHRKAPMVWTVFYIYLAVLIAGQVYVIMGFGDKEHATKYFVMTGIIFLTTLILSVFYWRTLVYQLKQFGFSKSWAWFGLALLIPVLGINYGYHEAIRQLVGEFYIDTGDFFQELREALGYWGIILIFAVFPAITEEIAFRGLVQHWLQATIKPRHAIILASALFMALHLNVISAPYLFMVGCLLGWVKYKTDSLYPSILIHGLHNYFVVEFMY